ncbi:MAG: hypothetical protein JXP34_18515 [Planctomycetes bacterium]|nr:hypothetical protein [Planctomycetota bacterium]
MKEDLRFNWLDIFRAPKVAFSVQKIWILFVGLFPAYLIYLALASLAMGSAEGPFSAAWGRVGIYGCPFIVGGYTPAWYGWILWGIGFLVLLSGFLLSGLGVARATYLQLKGETFFTWTEIYKFVLKYWKSVLTSPVGLLAFIVGYALAGACIGLVGRIPYVGGLWIAGLSFFWIWCAVFLLFLIIAFIFSVLLAPAVISTTRGDFFEVITETFSCAFNEPWRLFLYEITIGGLIWLFGGIFRAFVMASFNLLGPILNLGFIKNAYVGWMWNKASWIVGEAVPPTGFWQNLLGLPASILGISMPSFDVVRAGNPGAAPDHLQWMNLGGYLIGITMLVFVFIVLCYAMSILISGNTLLYIVLRKKKDDEDLLDIEEEEEEEPAPADEAKPAEGEAPAAPVEGGAPVEEAKAEETEPDKPEETKPAEGGESAAPETQEPQKPEGETPPEEGAAPPA